MSVETQTKEMTSGWKPMNLRQAMIHVVERQMQIARSSVLEVASGKMYNTQRLIAEAPPYWFAPDFIQIALAQPLVDLQWHPSLLQTPTGFAVLGWPVLFEDIPPGTTRDLLGDVVLVESFYWAILPGSQTFIGVTLVNSDAKQCLAAGMWTEGEWLSARVTADEEDSLRGSERHVFRTVLPTLTLLIAIANQKLAIYDSGRLPRQLRRSGWAKGSDGTVTIVHLRSRGSTRAPHNDEAPGPDWTHRWVVRGHWRQQFYQTTNTHRPVFVGPYVKGPEDKPLLVKRIQYAADR